MAAYVARRIVLIALVLVAVSILVFAITTLLPGNVAYLILGPFATPEQVHALHILLKTEGKDVAAVRKQAEAVLKEARASGADFAALARKYSEDEGSKGSGGDLNFFGRGSMVKPFEDAAFAEEVAEVLDCAGVEAGDPGLGDALAGGQLGHGDVLEVERVDELLLVLGELSERVHD